MQPPLQPASIKISSSQTWVLAARSIRLSVEAFDGQGGPLPAESIDWGSSNTAVARIGPDGRVEGLTPGTVTITASSGSVSSAIRIEVHPLRIEIEPDPIALEAGSELGLGVRILDADGSPIVAQSIEWTSANSKIASLDANGILRAVSPGSVTVTARIDSPDATSIAFSARAVVLVRPRPDFNIERMVSADQRINGLTIRRVDTIWPAGRDRVAAILQLSNGAQAAVVVENGQIRPLLTTGDQIPTGNGYVAGIDFLTASMNGAVLIRPRFHSGFLVFRPGSASPQSLELPPQYGWVNELDINEAGDIAMIVNEFGLQRVVMIRGSNGSLVDVARPNEFGQPTCFSNVKALSNGNVVFRTGGCDSRLVLREWNAVTGTRPLCAPGDVVLGRVVRECQLPSGPLASQEIYTVAWGDNFPNILLRRNRDNNTWTEVVRQGAAIAGGTTLESVNGLFAVYGSTIVFGAGTNQGGRFLLASATAGATPQLRSIAQNGTGASDWTWLSNVVIDGDRIYALGLSGTGISQVVRVGPDPVVQLIRTGDPFRFPAGPAWDWHSLRTGRGSQPDSQLIGAGEVVGRVRGSNIEPVMGPGDALPGGRTWISTNGMEILPDGSVAVLTNTASGFAIYLWREGRFTLAADQSSTRIGGQQISSFCCGPVFGANTKGQVISPVQWNGGSGIGRFREGLANAEVVYRDGMPQSAAMDDSGRVVLWTFQPNNQQVLLLWEDGGRVTRLRTQGDPGPDGRPLQRITRIVASGNAFYFLADYGQGMWEVSEYTTAWRVIDNGPMRDGVLASNPTGETAYHPSDNRNGIVLRGRGGIERRIAELGGRLNESSWWLDLMGAAMTANGEVWFTGQTSGTGGSPPALFRATPKR